MVKTFEIEIFILLMIVAAHAGFASGWEMLK